MGRRVMRVAAVVAVLGCLAGCGTTPYRPAAAGAPAGKRPASTEPGVPAAGTRAEAEAEARRLLSGLVLPAGTRRLPQRPVPSAVSQPGQNFGAGLDVYRLFRVPLSMEAAEQFVWAHLPASQTSAGTGWAGQAGVVQNDSLTVEVPARAVPAGIDVAQLVYTIAPQAGGGSVLRADAQIIIFPARSAAEYLDPAGIRSVTVSTIGPDPLRRTITARAEITRLARLVDGEHAFPAGLVYPCPLELGPGYQLTFTPVSARQPTVVVDPTNCGGSAVFANGVRQPALMGTGLYAVTEQLLPGPQRAR